MIHTVREVLSDHNCSVAVSGLHAFYRILFRFGEYPSDIILLLQLLHDFSAHVRLVTIQIRTPLIEIADRYTDVAGIRIRIPVRIDIKPCIESRKKT